MKSFRRIASAIDPTPFLDEIATVDGTWKTPAGRQSATDVPREAPAIPLRGLRRSAIRGRARRDVHECRWTNAAKLYPTVCRFLHDFATDQDALLGRAKVVCLPAGGRLQGQVDRGDYHRARDRYHLVLRAARGASFKAGGEEARMREGELWWLDNKQRHEAVNDGEEDRVHLIFDLLPRARADEIFGRQAEGEWRTMRLKAPTEIGPLPANGVALQRRPAKGRGSLGCWLALPPEIATDAPPLVTVHGIHRGARKQAEIFAERAAALGRPVIAPLFDLDNWPRYQTVVRKQRADVALLELMAELRLAGIWQTSSFELFGYSGGGQFAHRFAMLYPHLIARLTVASSGWFTFPDSAAFPYGLGVSSGKDDGWGPRLAAGLGEFLRLPIQVCVGAEDTVRDPNTRRGEDIDQQQGSDRVARAERWAAALREAAGARGITPRVTLSVLPDCGHDFEACVRRGGLDRIVLPDAPAEAATDSDASAHAPAA